MGIVDMSVTMSPTGALKSVLDDAKTALRNQPAVTFDKPRIGSGTIELRVAFQQGKYLWGIVESYPNGAQEILLGGGKPTLMEASVEGATAFEALFSGRGGK